MMNTMALVLSSQARDTTSRSISNFRREKKQCCLRHEINIMSFVDVVVVFAIVVVVDDVVDDVVVVDVVVDIIIIVVCP